MSQTLPQLHEGVVDVDSMLPAEASGALELLQDAGTDGPANYFLGPASCRRTEAKDRLPVVELAIPVYNEERTLEASIVRLRSYLDEMFPFETRVRIVDNASIDGTWGVATRLASSLYGVDALRLDQKGKGRAIRAAWSTSNAEIVAYMDVDLSTDLGGLLPLVAPLLSGHSDVSIGSRLAPGARVLRGARREVVSRAYHLVLRLALGNRFSDATCGFKAARRETAQVLLPLVADDHWFFDTELLVLAERNGFRIHEVPVDWVDDADSRVNIRSVARGDLKGIARLMRNRATGQERRTSADSSRHQRHSGQGTRYAGVGVLSTIAYLAIFMALRHSLGTYAANVVGFAVTSVGNTLAHLRFTFGPKSGMRLREAALAGSLAFVTGIALTTFALGMEAILGTTSALAEAVAILLGTVTAGFVRLVLLRASAYRTHTQGGARS